MEHPIKDGFLYIQHPKFGKKTWRKVWVQLFADSPFGVARLEYFEARDGGAAGKATLRKGERKVIRLSDCVSVERAEDQSSPKETVPFYLCMLERNWMFAADQPNEWIEFICQLAFQKRPSQSSPVGNTSSPQLLMEENSIYSSWKEICEFPVSVFPTEASARCQLKGNYLMVSLPEQLVLKDVQSGQIQYNWPYTFLRRFGQEKSSFSFEAGRRCDSGEGVFTFNTSQAAEIGKAVSAAIEHQKAILMEDNKKGGVSQAQDCMQKAGLRSWASSTQSMDEMQPLPKGSMEINLSSENHSPELETPEPPIIYASIGKSFPLMFQPWGKTEAESQRQGAQLSDHLYENLHDLEQRASASECLGFSYGDSPEGSKNNDQLSIYDSPKTPKRLSGHFVSSARADSSPDRQCPSHPLDSQEAASGGERSGRPKGRGAFRHKLVTMLSRDGCGGKNKNSNQVDKP
ncbi:PREDICTED: docking protein 3 [Thamnophis sirtalis]|uniref:Docking protein 3 n=1 Tax=Thamnophis sirtalis TaxID=35019 RepID=A0A6I9X810_9SAUR|nr:PREDICTED: docking protein 3 [Thamnophis sirtalis]